MELGIDSIHDFNIKYRDTMGVADNEVVLVQHLEEDGQLEMYRAVNDSWVPFNKQLSDISIDFTVPACGVVNHDHIAVDVYRTGARQYRRGFTFHNQAFKTAPILHKQQRHLWKKDFSSDAKLVNNVFNPVYYEPEGGLSEIIEKKRLVSAITNRYFFSVSPDVPYIYLGYDKYIIGRVNESNARCRLFKSAMPLAEDVAKYIELI